MHADLVASKEYRALPAAVQGGRPLAIVSLTDAGRRIDEVARVFGLAATYVSIMRGKSRESDSAGLVKRIGRPRKLSDRQVARTQGWAAAGWTQRAIADRLKVARSVIGKVLVRVGPAPVQHVLPEPDVDVEPTVVEDTHPDAALTAPMQVGDSFMGSARITTGTRSCRYAGAMLPYPYVDMVAAERVFASLTGARRRAGMTTCRS